MIREYEVKHEILIATQLANKFEEFYIDHVPRYDNTYTDALALLAATLVLPSGSTKHVTIGGYELLHPEAIMEISEACQVGI